MRLTRALLLAVGASAHGRVALVDPQSLLVSTEGAGIGHVGALALGEWLSRLGAAGGLEDGLPVAEVLAPARRVAVLVVPDAAALDDDATAREISPELDAAAELGLGARLALSPRAVSISCVSGGGSSVGRAVCADAHDQLDVQGAFARFASASHPLAVALLAGGGTIVRSAGSELVSSVSGSARAPALRVDAAHAENRALLGELARLVEIASEPLAVQDEARLDVLVASFLARVSANDRPAALALVRPTARAVADAISADGRRSLLALVALDAGAELLDAGRRLGESNTSANATYYSLEQVREYQLGLWTAIVLACVLGAAVAGMVFMNPEYDSLLYATFQANVNSASKLE